MLLKKKKNKVRISEQKKNMNKDDYEEYDDDELERGGERARESERE